MNRLCLYGTMSFINFDYFIFKYGEIFSENLSSNKRMLKWKSLEWLGLVEISMENIKELHVTNQSTKSWWVDLRNEWKSGIRNEDSSQIRQKFQTFLRSYKRSLDSTQASFKKVWIILLDLWKIKSYILITDQQLTGELNGRLRCYSSNQD